jgi:hypothetical protein
VVEVLEGCNRAAHEGGGLGAENQRVPPGHGCG